MSPTVRDLEEAMKAQVYFAKRVMVTDPRHAGFHEEINHLLDEWQELRSRRLTRLARFR